jgi:hypothetical protein
MLTFLQTSTITAYLAELIRATANIINEFVIVVETRIVSMIRDVVNIVCCSRSIVKYFLHIQDKNKLNNILNKLYRNEGRIR